MNMNIHNAEKIEIGKTTIFKKTKNRKKDFVANEVIITYKDNYGNKQEFGITLITESENKFIKLVSGLGQIEEVQ
jgi:predicted nuclease of restriction endonuclease-like RecB superfamily